jgi:NAD(P)-dependent dehydrogenase (short-subunit alcohol dehydrogenase family)
VTTIDMTNRVALVTGAGRGIGREIALGLADAGAKVALVARSQRELDAVASEIRLAQGTALALVADVSDPAQIRGAAACATAELGDIGLLVNNAAVVGPLGATSELDPVEVSQSLAVNVAAVITLTAAVIPAMATAGWGRVVNISSGIVSNPGMMIGGTVYAASKAAIEAHTLNLAAELRGTGITVNAYRPGAVDTAMQQWIRDQPPEQIGTALHERFSANHAHGNLITPHKSAAALLSHLSTDDTGQIWDVNDNSQP